MTTVRQPSPAARTLAFGERKFASTPTSMAHGYADVYSLTDQPKLTSSSVEAAGPINIFADQPNAGATPTHFIPLLPNEANWGASPNARIAPSVLAMM